MKLNEILGIKQLKGKTRSEVGEIAIAGGKWKKLGEGYASVVYEYEGVVYKFWYSDPPYDKFVAWALEHPNKHFPKFLSKIKKVPADFLAKHPSTPKNMKYIMMEKIDTSITPDYEVKLNSKYSLSIRRIYYNISDILSFMTGKRPEWYEWLCDSCLLSAEHEANGLSGGRTLWQVVNDKVKPETELDEDAKLFFKALIEIFQLTDYEKVKLDLNNISNYGVGKQGSTLVIYDPLMSWGSHSKNKTWYDFEVNKEYQDILAFRKERGLS